MLLSSTETIDFLNSFLNMGRFRFECIKSFDFEAGYTRHRVKLFYKDPTQTVLNKFIFGQKLIEIGTIEQSSQFEYVIFLKYQFRYAFSEITDLCDRALKMGFMLNKFPPNVNILVKILPPPNGR